MRSASRRRRRARGCFTRAASCGTPWSGRGVHHAQSGECERLWEVDAYREGRLGERDAASFERHVRRCASAGQKAARRAAGARWPGRCRRRRADRALAARLRMRVLRDVAAGSRRARAASWWRGRARRVGRGGARGPPRPRAWAVTGRPQPGAASERRGATAPGVRGGERRRPPAPSGLAGSVAASAARAGRRRARAGSSASRSTAGASRFTCARSRRRALPRRPCPTARSRCAARRST